MLMHQLNPSMHFVVSSIAAVSYSPDVYRVLPLLLIYSKSMNIRFFNRRSTKTINNRKIIGLNRMGRLKNRIEIFFGRCT